MENSRNGERTIRDFYMANKKDFISFLKSEGLAESTAKEYIDALENKLEPVHTPPDIGTYHEKYGKPITSKIERAIGKLLRYNEIRHASNELLGYDHKLWRVQFSTKGVRSTEGSRSGTRVKDWTEDEIIRGYQRLDPDLKTFYKFLVYTGMRGKQAYDILKAWNPDKIQRLSKTVDGEKIHYAKYATSEVSRGKKNAFFAYFPAEMIEELNKYTLPGTVNNISQKIQRQATTDEKRPINVVNLRKFNNNILQKGKAIDSNTANYIQGRRPKGVSQKYYDDLEGFADEQYPIALKRNFGKDFFGQKINTSPAPKPAPQKNKGHSGQNKKPMDEKELDRMLRSGMTHAQIIKTLPGANKTKIAAYVKAHPELKRK